MIKNNYTLIGLTGGICCGKSTVGKLLKEKGYPICEADHIVRSLYQEKETQEFILSQFKTLNKEELRKLLINKPQAKEALETYFHPKVWVAFNHFISKHKGEHSLIFLDIPLLFEKNSQDKVNWTVCVHCSPEFQIKRLMKRDHVSATMAKSLLQTQMPIDKKVTLADFLIKNEGNLDQLKVKVENFLTNIKKLT